MSQRVTTMLSQSDNVTDVTGTFRSQPKLLSEAELLAYLDTILQRAKDRPYHTTQGLMSIPPTREPRE